jgi:hypothetical protein
MCVLLCVRGGVVLLFFWLSLASVCCWLCICHVTMCVYPICCISDLFSTPDRAYQTTSSDNDSPGDSPPSTYTYIVTDGVHTEEFHESSLPMLFFGGDDDDVGTIAVLDNPPEAMVDSRMQCVVDATRASLRARLYGAMRCFPMHVEAILARSTKTCVFACRTWGCNVVGYQLGAVPYAAKLALRGGPAPLEREYDILKALQGIDGVPVPYFFGAWNGSHVLVTEGVGESASCILKQRQHALQAHGGESQLFSLDELKQMTTDLVGILQAVHHRGFLHRDVCPGNVLFLNGRWQLIDFGSAGRVGEADWDTAQQMRTFDVQHAYASARLLRTSAPLDEEDDFDALVKTLSRLYSGRRGEEHQNMRALVAQARHQVDSTAVKSKTE